jgi:hypothetical protein
MLAAISRSVFSASARRESSSRDWPSSSMSRAFWIATVAWSANASISAASSSSYASRAVELILITPRRPSSVKSGATTTERIPVSDTNVSKSWVWPKRSSVR